MSEERKTIYLCLAHMSEEGWEQKYVKEAFDTNWVVPMGPNVNAFEKDLEAFANSKSDGSQPLDRKVVCLSAGTAAVHLALIGCGVKAGDEVLVQSYTFCASSHPITYLGAKPIFIGSEGETWNMDPQLLEKAIIDRKEKTGKYPKAIIPVHLYGMPAKLDEICAIAEKYNIPICEDAAEAIGSEYKGQKCGTFGEFGALSFNGNKMITTSGGGALICRTEEEAKRTIFYATQAREDRPYYYHKHIGYNYRLSNICAGIGRGQMTVLEQYIARRRAIHTLYSENFADTEGIHVKQNPSSEYDSNFWLTCIEVDAKKCNNKTANDIRIHLEQENIESRLLWRPMHMQPIFSRNAYYGNKIAETIFERGLCLPSGPSLTDEQILEVVSSIKKFIR